MSDCGGDCGGGGGGGCHGGGGGGGGYHGGGGDGGGCYVGGGGGGGGWGGGRGGWGHVGGWSGDWNDRSDGWGDNGVLDGSHHSRDRGGHYYTADSKAGYYYDGDDKDWIDHDNLEDLIRARRNANSADSKNTNPAPRTDDHKETPNTDSLERETWSGRFDFILSLMGYSIGLGNVWRFPYLCYENGGGAFLIPYFVVILVVALPFIFLELSLGQFSSRGCIGVWSHTRLFKGVGFAMVFLSSCFCLYYNVILGYCILYMVVSFHGELPWTSCDNSWNTADCFTRESLSHAHSPAEANGSTPSASSVASLFDNFSFVAANMTEKRVRPTEEYWKYHVLGLSEGLHDLGSVRWQLLLCFIAAWIIVYVCISKGIKSSGKVVYFTATFPFVLLFILLIRGLTLEGSLNGVLFFIWPDFKVLKQARVWTAAANQVFLSFSPGWGGMHTLASYNKFNNNCYRDAFLFCISCACTSILSGFVMFSIVGFMAHDSNREVDEVVDVGYGLAFVVFPEAVSLMLGSNVWAVLFFLMLIILGLDSQFVTLETLITAANDELALVWPSMRKRKHLVILVTCLGMCLIGLPFVTEGGMYVMQLLDWYVAGFSAMITVFIEAMVVCYIYGGRRITSEINVMLGFTPSLYWRLCWMFISPGFIVLIAVFSFLDYERPTVGDYTFPLWADALGWGLVSLTLVFIIVYAVYYLCSQTGPFLERLRESLTPSADWGPALNKNREKAGYPLLSGRGGTLDDEEEALQLRQRLMDKDDAVADATTAADSRV